MVTFRGIGEFALAQHQINFGAVSTGGACTAHTVQCTIAVAGPFPRQARAAKGDNACKA